MLEDANANSQDWFRLRRQSFPNLVSAYATLTSHFAVACTDKTVKQTVATAQRVHLKGKFMLCSDRRNLLSYCRKTFPKIEN